MKISCGTDIIEISRIKDSIEGHGGRFRKEIFTVKEIEYCESHKMQKYQHYAARFAAKEAAFKAISERLKDKYELCWKDYEVISDENGKPHLNILGINEKNETYLCQIVNDTLKQKGIKNKKVDKINYTLKGVKALKKMFIDLIEEENKNK